jgi:hypothetical protein
MLNNTITVAHSRFWNPFTRGVVAGFNQNHSSNVFVLTIRDLAVEFFKPS